MATFRLVAEIQPERGTFLEKPSEDKLAGVGEGLRFDFV
jgi:hypothetical protein